MDTIGMMYEILTFINSMMKQPIKLPKRAVDTEDSITICIEGTRLNKEQTKVVLPILKLHRDGKISHEVFVSRSIRACVKANNPIHEETDDY